MFDAMHEELEIEFNSRFDYIREAFGDMVEDPVTLDHEAQAYAEEWQAERDAFIGPRLPAPVYEDDIIPF